MTTLPGLYGRMVLSAEEKLIPLTVFLEITRFCNLSCHHCYHEDLTGPHMSMSLYKKVLYQLKKAGSFFLLLSGGEPLVHPNFKEFISLAVDEDFALTLLTNGTLLDEPMVEFLAQEGIASVCVTLYGMDAAVHDAVTSHPGSFAKTRAGIENLQKAKVRTEIKTPVLKQNFHQIGALAQWSSDKGISFRPDALITPKNSGCDAPLAQSPTAEEIRIALSTFPEEREIAEGIETLHCNAGFNYGAITTEGKILPCIQFPHEIGSIEKDDFSEVWKNASFLQKLRTTTNDDLTKCLECGYLKYCDRCPGLAYIATGTHCGIAPVCCELAKIRANN